MRATGPRSHQRSETRGYGPQIGFAVAVIAGFAAWSGFIVPLHADLAMPVFATLLLTFAAAFGIFAWHHGKPDPARVTYADVAGALTLIGLFAAATIEPDQLAGLIAERGGTRH